MFMFNYVNWYIEKEREDDDDAWAECLQKFEN